MSLAYANDDFQHKTLVIGEASGIKNGDGASLLRQLISEGRIVHRTVIDGKGQELAIEGPLWLMAEAGCVEPQG
jgi:hypothetical protein